jgi:hypothetical protein
VSGWPPGAPITACAVSLAKGYALGLCSKHSHDWSLCDVRALAREVADHTPDLPPARLKSTLVMSASRGSHAETGGEGSMTRSAVSVAGRGLGTARGRAVLLARR